MNLVIEIIAYFCECMTQLLCIHAFAGKKIKFDVKTVVFVIIYVVIADAMNNLQLSTILLLIIVEIFLFIYVLWEFKLKIFYSFILMVLNLLVSVSMQAIGALPVYILTFIFKEINNPYILQLSINMLSLGLICLFTHVFRLNKLYIQAIKWDKMIVRCLTLFAVFILYLMIKFKLENKMVVRAYFISGIIVCIAVAIMLKWQSDRYKMKQKTLELRMHEIYGSAFEGMIESIRIRQHDYKNQLAAIYGMHLTANSFEELVENQKKYCDNLMKESRFDSILTSCKDKILAGFLYTKFTECEKVGMQMNFEISVNDSACKLATYELIEVMGILLDNAVEYEIEHKKGKQIYFKLNDYEDKLNIVCRNMVDDISLDKINDFFKKGYSTKGENRGLGLYNVKNTLEGNGEIYVSTEQIEESIWLEFNIEVNR